MGDYYSGDFFSPESDTFILWLLLRTLDPVSVIVLKMSCFLGSIISKVRKRKEKEDRLWDKVFHGVRQAGKQELLKQKCR